MRPRSVLLISWEKREILMDCRPGCGACCIAISLSSPIPGMQSGKPAGIRCIQLTENNLCKLFDSPHRPRVCNNLRPDREMCGSTTAEAMAYLEKLEAWTRPGT